MNVDFFFFFLAQSEYENRNTGAPNQLFIPVTLVHPAIQFNVVTHCIM